MKPEQIENKRYKTRDFCEIKKEEEIMFEMLDDYFKESNKKAKNDLKILDIGCGSGKITNIIKNKGYDVYGLDFSYEAVRKAIQLGIHADICNLDEGIKGSNNSFDVVWAGDIIEHVFDPIGLLKEANRVLRKGGKLLITIPNDVGLITRIRILFGISYQAQMYKSAGYFKHHTFFTLDLIKFMLENARFKIKEVQKILNLGKKRISINYAPSFLYNELVIKAEKK